MIIKKLPEKAKAKGQWAATLAIKSYPVSLIHTSPETKVMQYSIPLTATKANVAAWSIKNEREN
ncbi:MAG: hypothetical protein QWI73_06670 [Alphaproteobacteria bacterium]|nr:hypothetical protein [Alphaproteobacteria bacterium]